MRSFTVFIGAEYLGMAALWYYLSMVLEEPDGGERFVVGGLASIGGIFLILAWKWGRRVSMVAGPLATFAFGVLTVSGFLGVIIFSLLMTKS